MGDGITVKNCNLLNACGPTIVATSHDLDNLIYNLSIKDNVIQGGQSDNISLHYCRYGMVTGNRIINGYSHAIHVYMHSEHCSIEGNHVIYNSELNMKNTTIDSVGSGIIIGHASRSIGSVKNTVVKSNVLDLNNEVVSGMGISVSEGVTGTTISDNILNKAFMRLGEETKGIVVTGNQIINGFHGILLVGSHDNVVISENQIIGGREGIRESGTLSDNHNFSITSNLIVDITNGEGIRIPKLKNSTIAENIIKNISGHGIYLIQYPEQVILNGNVIMGCERGIYITSGTNMSILGNNIQNSRGQGILLIGTTHSNIANNVVTASNQSNLTSANIEISGSPSLEEYSHYNNVQNNTCRRGSGTIKAYYGIYLRHSESTGNIIANNDLYQSGNNADILDNGTGTVTLGGNRLTQ